MYKSLNIFVKLSQTNYREQREIFSKITPWGHKNQIFGGNKHPKWLVKGIKRYLNLLARELVQVNVEMYVCSNCKETPLKKELRKISLYK